MYSGGMSESESKMVCEQISTFCTGQDVSERVEPGSDFRRTRRVCPECNALLEALAMDALLDNAED